MYIFLFLLLLLPPFVNSIESDCFFCEIEDRLIEIEMRWSVYVCLSWMERADREIGFFFLQQIRNFSTLVSKNNRWSTLEFKLIHIQRLLLSLSSSSLLKCSRLKRSSLVCLCVFYFWVFDFWHDLKILFQCEFLLPFYWFPYCGQSGFFFRFWGIAIIVCVAFVFVFVGRKSWQQ